MKIETVIKLLEANKNHYENGSMAEALETAIKALEKQIAKEPCIKPHPYQVLYGIHCGHCPSCGSGVISSGRFCLECGQKLKWPSRRR